MSSARLNIIVCGAAGIALAGVVLIYRSLPARTTPTAPLVVQNKQRHKDPLPDHPRDNLTLPPKPFNNQEDTDNRLPGFRDDDPLEPRAVLEPPVLSAIPLASLDPELKPGVMPQLPSESEKRTKPVDTIGSIKLVRRQEKDEETLIDRLKTVPEFAIYTQFTIADANALARDTLMLRNQGRFRPETVPDPYLLRSGLPIIAGEACRLSDDAADALQTGSLSLRELLTGQRRGIGFVSLRTVDSDHPGVVAEHLQAKGDGHNNWLRPHAIPVMMQMMMAEKPEMRAVLIDTLAKIDGPRATAALAVRACTDLNRMCRTKAIEALNRRPREQYVGLLLTALRHPFDAIADHAAEALVSLRRKEVVPALVQMLDLPDPSLPYAKPNKSGKFIREMVRINHLRGCLICHAQSTSGTDKVRAAVPPTDRALNPAGSYNWDGGVFITARITYVRQDFSHNLEVSDPGKWPEQQRFDFLTRERPAQKQELERKLVGLTPHQKALTWTLEHLTGKNPGPNPEDWKRLYLDQSLPVEKRHSALRDATALTVDENGTAYIAEHGRILKVDSNAGRAVWHEFEGSMRGLALDARNGLLVSYDHARWLQRFDLRTKEKQPLGGGKAFLNDPRRPNADKHGGAYLCDGDRAVHYLQAGGTFKKLNLGKLKADQLAVGPDGDFLFVASESELWGCSIESAGVVGKPIRVAKVASPGGIRDLAVDGRGLVSVVHGGGVDVITPEGLRLATARLPDVPTAVVARGETLHVLTKDSLYAVDLAGVIRP